MPDGGVPKGKKRPHDTYLFSDDIVEVFIDPGMQRGRYYQFALNAHGSTFDASRNSGGAVDPALFGRMVIYKALCDLLWTLWGLIQHANDNPVDDFWAYATGRFARCKELMAEPHFTDHVAAV